MPKQTFYNLDEEKQSRIFEAGVLEFSYHDVHEASVNTIVRIANISKGSFYQYFEDKLEFYWYVVMEVIFGNIHTYERMLAFYEGDFLKAEEELFTKLLDLFDDNQYRNFLRNVYQATYVDLTEKFSGKSSTIYFKMYDTLMKFGFKGYNIQSKEDFLIVFDMVRNISNNTILTMIREGLSKQKTKQYFHDQLQVLSNGIKRRGLFG